jgi:hypothetical protein
MKIKTNDKTNNLIEDLKKVFKKHDVYLNVSDDYDGQENWCGQTVEIKSEEFVDNGFVIHIDDMEELASKINP